ncbi:MAG: hypothetical protein QXU92_03000 [Candidatus Diapherotrites archaeon]
MKTLKKIVLLLVGLIILSVILAQIGVIYVGSKGIEQIDKKFGISNYSIYPEKEKIEKYEKEILSVITFTENEQKEKKIKIKLIEFQNSFQNYLEERLKVDFEYPKCYFESPEQKMKNSFKIALEKAIEINEELESFEKESVGNISKRTLQEIIQNSKNTLQNSKKVIEKIC